MSALTLGIPSKGRLYEQVVAYLGDTGMKPTQAAGGRGYQTGIVGMPAVDVKLLSAADIAAALRDGDIHFGITGEDLIRESVPDLAGSISLLQPLDFGFADVVVAVPKAWIDVSTMADLDDVCTAFHLHHHRRLRVATKYGAQTRAFFAAHGIADYRIIESLGATEGTPAAGTAEAIVDITTSGATLAANELKSLDDGVILKSQAQLGASLKARWNASTLAVAERFTARLAARELARASQILRVRIDRSASAIVSQLGKTAGCTVLSRPAEGNRAGEYAILCPRDTLMDAIDALRARGVAEAIGVHRADYVFAQANPLGDKLRAALKR